MVLASIFCAFVIICLLVVVLYYAFDNFDNKKDIVDGVDLLKLYDRTGEYVNKTPPNAPPDGIEFIPEFDNKFVFQEYVRFNKIDPINDMYSDENVDITTVRPSPIWEPNMCKVIGDCNDIETYVNSVDEIRMIPSKKKYNAIKS